MKALKKLAALLALLSVAGSLIGCAEKEKKYSVTYTDVFDTVTEFSAYCDSEKTFDRVSAAVHAELIRLHELFDIYNEYDGVTNAATVNRLAGEGAVKAPEELLQLLSVYAEFYRGSGGKLDPSLGPVLRIWRECRDNGALPEREALEEAAHHAGFPLVVINGGAVSFSDPAASLDLGAVAKGYAAGKAAEAAKKAGAENFALNLGGNVVTSGKKPSGDWIVGVRDPDGGILKKVGVSDACVVTSGDYQRYYEVNGKKYHHIIDPDTLYPAGLYHSVTVICKDPAAADALSTALFCMGEEEGIKLASGYGAEALYIRVDGTVRETEGFAAYER